MTTKATVRKFRIKRAPVAMPAQQALRSGGGEIMDARTPEVAPRPSQMMRGEVSSAAEVSAEQEMDAIRREGLTGRQLRMARRLAQKHGLAATSDMDAVRLLRRRGIDPFRRSTMLELVVPDAPEPTANLPQTVPQHPVPGPHTPPSPQVMAEETRAREIIEMQRDIARRRRRRSALLAMRLAFFVLLPTVMAWFYYARIATPLYATNTELVIQQADAAAATGGVGGLLSGTSFATATDSITVQSFLESREAMLRLDAEHGFKAHFSQDFVDPLQRLEPDSTNEAAYKLYTRNVKIGYDPTEGVIRMEVIAADPQTSVEFANALIGYAEEQVDQLTQRKRADQMSGAMENYEDASQKVQEAQANVLELQERMGVLDPVAESGMLMSQITTFDTQLREKRLQLQQLLDNPRPNQARVDGVQGDIDRLEAVIADLRGQLTDATAENGSLASISGQLRMAEADLQSRQLLLQSALQQVETARIEAGRQVRYVSMGVRPVAPDEPTYPRVFENTMLAFFIFAGLYLMASLTGSILREQVTA